MPLIWLAALAAAPNAQPPTAPEKQTRQQQFDAASAAVTAGKCAEAVRLFEVLQGQLKPGSLPAAASAARKGTCLIRIGRTAEGEAAILGGLPTLEKAGPEFVGDRVESLHSLGDAALSRGDFGTGRQRYEAALALLSGADRAPTLLRLARATAFDGGSASLSYADEALRTLAADPKIPKDALAAARTIRARTLLNQGRNDEAYAELKAALALSGGLTLKTSVGEASMRGDLALAAMIVGRKDDARRYLAYTGQGRLTNSPFQVAVSMRPPDCGETSGLDPKDFAVVEFSIADDGTVAAAQTVYSRGGPQVAAAFAKAVRTWFWRPEDIAKIPAFYRVSTRVELRCTTAAGAERSIMAPLVGRFNSWASKWTGLEQLGEKPRSDEQRQLQAKLAQAEQSGSAEGRAAALGQLILSGSAIQNLPAQLDRALAQTTSLPQVLVNMLRVLQFFDAAKERPAAADYLALAETPSMAADPIAFTTVKMLAATSGRNGSLIAEAEPLLRSVADDVRLPAGHPLRQVATLYLANRAAEKGDLAGAHSFFERTGLTEQQCALLGPTPVLRRTGADSNDYPNEALAMGFEGWVKLEYDIKADGSVTGVRSVIAYPPFVFVEAATRMGSDLRYARTFRPNNDLACTANTNTIRFVLSTGR